MRRERENVTGLRKGKKNKRRKRSYVTVPWVSEWGEKKRREKEEQMKIEVWVSKIVKKERFKNEEYKRERETYLWIFELDTESTVIGREQWGWECDRVFDLFVCVCLSVGLGVWFVCLCLFECGVGCLICLSGCD